MFKYKINILIIVIGFFINTIVIAGEDLYLGKDWQRLIEIRDKYPVGIATIYRQTIAAQSQRLRSSQYNKTYRSSGDYQIIKQQAHDQLMSFKNDINAWLREVELKKKLNNISQDRLALLTQVVDALNKYVLPRIEQNGLDTFHQFLKDIMASPQTAAQYQRANFIGRYLKPEYAQNYKDQKIEFYQDLQNNILHEIQALNNQPNHTKRLQALHTELNFVSKRLNKWTHMPIMADMNPIRIFPLDEVMGIQNIKDLGYRGRGIDVGIIEPLEGETSSQAHSSFKDRISLDSSIFSKVHGTHVTGIVAARAETILDRDGVAPDVNISYAPIQLMGGTTIEYQDASTSKSIEPSIISGSLPNNQNDQAMADILQRMIEKHIKIVNMSMVYSVGPKTYLALKHFAHEGGVIVKAAGNSGVTIEPKINLSKYTLTKNQKSQISIDIGLFNTVMADPELKNAFLIIGNMNSATTLSKSSNRAGFTADDYVAAWGTSIPSTVGHFHRGVLSGTSMAAPMVSGALALLVQAFPNCGPQNLARNILTSATPMGAAKEFGHGRLDLSHAFTLSEETCGVAVPPPTD